MIRKALNAMQGIKATTQLHQRTTTPHKKHRTVDSQERVDVCLNCTKPARECKGDCFGRSH